jgi:hypothetical protein
MKSVIFCSNENATGTTVYFILGRYAVVPRLTRHFRDAKQAREVDSDITLIYALRPLAGLGLDHRDRGTECDTVTFV